MTARSYSWRASITIGVTVGMIVAASLGAMTTFHNRPLGATGLGGSAGTDTALPATSSQVTVSGRNQFSNLRITINQTQQLVNQAISLTWTGGPPTYTDPALGTFNGKFAADYLQIFQCWSDASVPDNVGPPPEQCEFGGEADPAVHPYPVSGTTDPFTRIISHPSWTSCGGGPASCVAYDQLKAEAAADPTKAYLDPTTLILDPFIAVDGTLVPASVDYNYANQIPYSAHDINPYFNHNDTNEIDFSRNYPDGSGADLFQVDTGLEAPGLGCGQQAEAHADGSMSVPKCWLVIVPRGTAAQENVPSDPVTTTVDTSPLNPIAWVNRIVVPLGFAPVGSSCALGGTVRRVVGSELAALAVASWQPTLCSAAGAPSYSYGALSDDRARSLLGTGAAAGGADMAVVSQPLDPSALDPNTPVTYAPITLSGVVIGFNIQRVPVLGSNGQLLSDEAQLAGRRVAELKLTPRLVAKLLTESYSAQFLYSPAAGPAGYTWLAHNPYSIVDDPEFLQYNPEFTELRATHAVDGSGLVVEQPASDAASSVWQWIFADPEAKAWLDGQPDGSGMRVNPYYSTGGTVNPSGVGFGAGSSVSQFPKSDPYCWTDPGDKVFGSPAVGPRPLCFLDWSPYQLNMHDTASSVRLANSGSRSTLNLGATDPTAAWAADGPQMTGGDFIMSITDSADAARFGLQTAMLSRAGDDGANRTFIAPDQGGLIAGEKAMAPSPVAGVLAPNPASTTPGAYPLAMLTYAATMPGTLDAAARKDYANFISYAVGAGQSPGTTFGQLPPGYAPLPSDLASQASAAAADILNPPTPITTTTTTTTAATTATTAASPAPIAATAPPPTPSSPPAAPGGASPASSIASGSPTGTVTQAFSVSGTSAPPVTATPRGRPTTPLVLAGRTQSARIGLVRWAVPVGVLCGLLAAGAAQGLGGFRRRRLVSAP